MPDHAVKFDTEKIRTDLLPVRAHLEVMRGFTYGARKYADFNFRKGMKHSRLFGAALRHLYAHMMGEDVDAESGIRHVALALCSLYMLLDSILLGNGEDDRQREQLAVPPAAPEK